MRFFIALSLFCSLSSLAYAELLPANKAFQFSVQSNTPKQATLSWQIEPNYYLYQQKFVVKQDGQTLKLKLPKGVSQYDENFGHSQVYWNQVSFSIDVQKNKTYTVMWQGCAKDQICYAPQQMQFQTDATGQVIAPQKEFSLKTTKSSSFFLQSKATASSPATFNESKPTMLVDEKIDKAEQKEQASAKSLADSSSKLVEQKKNSLLSEKEKTLASSEKEKSAQPTVEKNTPDIAQSSKKSADIEQKDEAISAVKISSVPASPLQANEETSDSQQALLTEKAETSAESLKVDGNYVSSSTNENASPVMAQDQHWLAQLQQHSFAYAVLLFLGLGFLLAFTPCSLPMIPILSSLLVREHKGVKAWTIALVFVLSMASVYAVMGFIASSAGLSLQRWLQQPATVIGFAILFVIFAINLFGAFEIKLPNRVVQRLDHWQSLQQGGTLASAGIMGVLSALLVGPCMTAPLAGVLLFIAQSEHQWQGAVLLFSMGFGMGIPLLLVSILGDRALPKAGQWMNQVKIFFGFVMLGLALYFIRPLLPSVIYQMVMAILALSALAYVLHHFMWKHRIFKVLYVLAVVTSLSSIGYYHYVQYQRSMSVTEQIVWHKVHNASELQQQIALAKGKKAVIDVYADWCVTCQPIERIFKQADVQNALQDYVMIKLDLSEYQSEHQALLDQLEVLGPPTVMFLDEQGQELRPYRLVGNFKKSELLQRIQH